MKRFASSFQRDFNTTIVVGGQKYKCWIAATQIDRTVGLMQHTLNRRHGCLLDFGEEVRGVNLWMKNCLHPLTALFADSEGVVLAKAEMTNLDPYRAHGCDRPFRYALELLPEDAESINIGDKILLWVDDE